MAPTPSTGEVGRGHVEKPTQRHLLDPFLGSGTTALAARSLKRRYIGIEINPEYVAIACKRLQNRTPSLFE